MEGVNELKFVKQIFIQPNQVKSRNNCYICIYKILPKSITGNMPKLKTVIIAFGLVCAAGATMAAPLPRTNMPQPGDGFRRFRNPLQCRQKPVI